MSNLEEFLNSGPMYEWAKPSVPSKVSGAEAMIEFRIRRYYQTGVISDLEMWELLILNWLT